jgi:hypothetical protein
MKLDALITLLQEIKAKEGNIETRFYQAADWEPLEPLYVKVSEDNRDMENPIRAVFLGE